MDDIFSQEMRSRLPRQFANAVGLSCLFVGVAACGTPAAPSTPVPNYAGIWTGAYTITGCTNIDGPGDTPVNLCASIEREDSYRFTLAQNGRTVTGTYTLLNALFSCPCGGDYGTFDMSGAVASDGTLQVLATGSPRATGLTAAIQLNLSLATTSTLTGTVSGSVTLGDHQRATFVGTTR